MTLTAVLLTGGESRRMGGDKAVIELHGQPLWRRQLEILRELQPERTFVSARTIPSWLPGDVALLLDDPPSSGPMSGLTKALAVMRTTHLVALAVDMPFMASGTLLNLCSLAEAGCGVVPMVDQHAEPLAAIYPAEAAADFAGALAGVDFSLQRLIGKLVAAKRVLLFPIPLEDEHFYRSVNAPDDIKEGRFPNRPP